MKRSISRYALFLGMIMSSFSFSLYIMCEGICAGTLVKTLYGYVPIEHLCVGDKVSCRDSENNYVESSITCIVTQKIESYITLICDSDVVYVASDHRFYLPETQEWRRAQDLRVGDKLGFNESNPKYVRAIFCNNNPAVFYLISVEKYHNYCITQSDILVHNIVPIAVGIAIAFGGGSITVSGFLFDVVLFGCIIGTHWKYKKNQSPPCTDISYDKKRNTNLCSMQALDVNLCLTHDHHEQQINYRITIAEDKNRLPLYQVNNSDNADAQAPGMPTKNDGFIPKKNWDGKKVKHPRGWGWPDNKGNVWIPSGPNGHGGPHWDVQKPGQSKNYENVLPGGRIRGKK